jgi:hypothetical protein
VDGLGVQCGSNWSRDRGDSHPRQGGAQDSVKGARDDGGLPLSFSDGSGL